MEVINSGKYDVNAMKVDFLQSWPEDQAYREERQQLHVQQEKGVEVPVHHQLHDSWILL